MAMKPPAADGVESQSARDADAIALKPDVPNVAADQIVDVLNVKQRMSAASSNIDLSSPRTSDPGVVVCGENWRKDFQLTSAARR